MILARPTGVNLVTCPTCRARYALPDGRTYGPATCRACGAALTANEFDSLPRSRPRRDSSHMFTLAELVGRASSTPPPPDEPTGAPKRDGSGIIDLNALAEAAEERARRVQSEPPPAAFAREASRRSLPGDTLPDPRRRLRYAAIAASAIALAVVGIAVAASGGEEPQKPHAVRTVAAPAQKVVDWRASTTVATSRSSDADKAVAPKVGARKGHRAAHRAAPASAGPQLTKVQSSGTGGPAAASAPPPPPKPKAASDPCGCKGNLQCAIKCFK